MGAQPGRVGRRRNLRSPLGFTLIEVLVVVVIIAVLIAILLPSLALARRQARTTLCLAHMRQLVVGWNLYAESSRDTYMPGRYCYEGASFTDSANWFDCGNGPKYCPRGFAMMGRYVGAFAFRRPSTSDDRQNYDNEVYRCPEVPLWLDERNYAYGYNHQFLGNNRRKSPDGPCYNYPVTRNRIKVPDSTVVFGDCMGTAAGVPAEERLPYDDNGKDVASLANHGWALDPPRLTPTSDRGTFKPSPRTAVDPRHVGGKVNVVFGDGHGQTSTPYALGYRILPNGAYVDTETVADPPSNRLFSGLGHDAPPPDKPP